MKQKPFISPIAEMRSRIQKVLDHTLNRLPEDFQDKIQNAEIKIINKTDAEILEGPMANLVTREVIIQETFLSYLWVCCYTVVGIYDMFYERAKDDLPIVYLNMFPEFPKIQLTLAWARGLKNEYSPWPVDAGNPNQNEPYVESANNIFEASVLYILFHEFGHVVCHADQPELIAANSVPYAERTKKEKDLIYNAEVEADQFAFDCLIRSSSLEDVRFVKYLGAVLAQFSHFFLLDVPDTRGVSHPDMDTRLLSVIRQVKLTDEHLLNHFKAHCSVGLQLFMSLTGMDYIPEREDQANFGQFGDLENYLFKRIAEIKDKARSFYGEH